VKDKERAHEYLARFIARLDDEDLSPIDFDELRKHLAELVTQSKTAGELAEEHALLREDCQQRMAGMIKAIAAADRRGESYQGALTIIEELPSLSARDLLRKYRRVSARFRDCFPTTFNGYQTGLGPSLNRSQLSDLR